MLRRMLAELFPASAASRFTHAWGGDARHPARLVPARSASTGAPGWRWAGGYVGDGVATTNLAGRTLRDARSWAATTRR